MMPIRGLIARYIAVMTADHAPPSEPRPKGLWSKDAGIGTQRNVAYVPLLGMKDITLNCSNFSGGLCV